jgi:hypothetical protein
MSILEGHAVGVIGVKIHETVAQKKLKLHKKMVTLVYKV